MGAVIKKAVCLILIAAVMCGAVSARSTPQVQNARSVILYEKTTDTILFEKEAERIMAPASMTKVMTAILVLEYNPTLEGVMTVSEQAVDPMYCSDMEDEHLYAGEEITVRACMEYMLIPSGNEGASALACYVAGNVPDFVDLMNAKAAELGCDDTQFRDPIGLVSGTHHTTCRDMLKICLYAMEMPLFCEIVNMIRGEVPASNMREYGFAYSSTNKIRLPGDRPAYLRDWRDDVIGIKTGTTGAAGQCFAGCMVSDGLEYYSVVMFGTSQILDDGRTYRGDFLDTLALYDWARTLHAVGVAAGDILGQVEVTGGLAGRVEAVAKNDVKLLLDDPNAVLSVSITASALKAPVKRGDLIGVATIASPDGITREVELLAAMDVQALRTYIVCALAAVLVILCVFAVAKRRRADK